MKNLFNSVQVRDLPHNTFDLTHDVKMSGRMGWLMPCLVMECVPGDKFNLSAEMLLRFAPMIAPVMHRFDVRCEYFFDANRLVWPEEGANGGWEQFIVDGTHGGVPFITISAATAGFELFLDYMGVPPFGGSGGAGSTTPTNINAIPFAMVQHIVNEYYRAQYVTPETPYILTDGDNNAQVADLLRQPVRCWEHDQFISALPFAQKGTAITLPLGEIQLDPNWDSALQTPTFRDDALTVLSGDVQVAAGDEIVTSPGITPMAYDPDGSLITGATTISDLRAAVKLQEWLERMALGGSRYKEVIKSMFNVNTGDARLNRPEYITGVKTPVIISDVVATAESAAGPQGNLAGKGTSIADGYNGNYYCREHGYVIGFISVMPKTAYQQGLPKHYLKFDVMDYYWHQFAHIGEQEITNDEIYAYAAPNPVPFGYGPRYHEYKFMPSRVAGDFRNSLDYWHAGRIFGAPPTLETAFLEMDATNVDRIFGVNDAHNLYMHVLHRIKANRPMDVYGTPML